MKINRIKNGYRISVKDWDKRVIITDSIKGTIIKEVELSNHIQAVLVAKAL